MPILKRILPQVLHMLENQNFYFIFSQNILTYNVLSFSSVSNAQMCHVFRILASILTTAYRTVLFQHFHFLGIDTDPDWHALKADPDPSKSVRSEPIPI
jgi:hypothetical protein